MTPDTPDAPDAPSLSEKYWNTMFKIDMFLAWRLDQPPDTPQFSTVEIPDALYYRALEHGVVFFDGGVAVPLERSPHSRVDQYAVVDREYLEIVLKNRWKPVFRRNVFRMRTVDIVPCARRGGQPSLFKQIYGETARKTEYCFIEYEGVRAVNYIVDYRHKHVWKITDRQDDSAMASVPLPCTVDCRYDLLEVTVSYAYTIGVNTENITVITLNCETGDIDWHSMYDNELTIVHHDKSYKRLDGTPAQLSVGPIKNRLGVIGDILEGKLSLGSLGYRTHLNEIARFHRGRVVHSAFRPATQSWEYSVVDGHVLRYAEQWYYNGRKYDDPVLVHAVNTVQMLVRRRQLSHKIQTRVTARETKDNTVQYLQRLPAGLCGKFPSFPGGEEYREVLEDLSA